MSTDESTTERRATRGATLAFFLSAAAFVALAVVYARGGQPPAEGALLCVGLGALGWGLIIVGHHLLGGPPRIEERHVLVDPEEEAKVDDALERATPITRRRLLTGSLVTAAGAFIAAAVFPVRSLGPAPGNALLVTPWRRGVRGITSDGRFILASEVPERGLVTMFPAGYPDSADGQAVLVRVPPEALQLPDDRAAGAPDGLVAYSKVCTHAGCPVGLYEASKSQLLCPCHQSAFDVLTGANPVSGPAARALPQLPIAIDPQGYIVALGDFSGPVGPSFWNRP
jgi:ubiquinol-cytochrome c reductase iron-sulfur subunit